MELINVSSHTDFLEKIKDLKKAYLLLYKSGSNTSECAYKNLKNVPQIDGIKIFAADVAKVRDIHPHYGIKTAPTLLEFEQGKYIKDIKGCNDSNYYKAIFENNVFQAVNKEGEEEKKQPRIVLYTTPSCPWCNRLKHYLKSLNFKYRDIDVSKDPKIAEELVRRTGQTGVPQAEINGQMVVGFDKPKIDKLLGIK